MVVAQIYPASISMVSSALGAVLYDALSSSWGILQTEVRLHPCCQGLLMRCSAAERSEDALMTRHAPAGLLLQSHRRLSEVPCRCRRDGLAHGGLPQPVQHKDAKLHGRRDAGTTSTLTASLHTTGPTAILVVISCPR